VNQVIKIVRSIKKPISKKKKKIPCWGWERKDHIGALVLQVVSFICQTALLSVVSWVSDIGSRKWFSTLTFGSSGLWLVFSCFHILIC
jgi:hypothetical protein